MELATWIKRVYPDNQHGLKSSWLLLVSRTMERSEGHTLLASSECYTIPLPSNLDSGSPDKPCTFLTNSSRPSILHGLDKGGVSELLCEW